MATSSRWARPPENWTRSRISTTPSTLRLSARGGRPRPVATNPDRDDLTWSTEPKQLLVDLPLSSAPNERRLRSHDRFPQDPQLLDLFHEFRFRFAR